MTTPLAFFNGRFVPFAEAALPLHDAGFVSGATVVDNARTFRHTLFRWPDHLARFRRDCAACYVALDATDAQLTAVAEELVAHNAKLLPPGGELQLVTFATPGPLGFYTGGAENGPAALGLVTYPLPFARYRPFFVEGARLAFAGWSAGHPGDLLPPRVKHRSRLVWHIAQQSVSDPRSGVYCPGAVPLVLNYAGVGDTAIGSVLAVADGTVYRPPADATQDSISVKVIGELCAAAGVKFAEAAFDLSSPWRDRAHQQDAIVSRASELLLAGTGFCAAGVRELVWYQQPRAFAWPGPVLCQLLAAWSDLVGVDVARQFVEAEAVGE